MLARRLLFRWNRVVNFIVRPIMDAIYVTWSIANAY